ncbi:hypothetical protein BC835DRAFT_499341 [Cytidiella melzeri]|nr:hypothetical protein BC835DRAFT_499341 [Cytidiella melzeri]
MISSLGTPDWNSWLGCSSLFVECSMDRRVIWRNILNSQYRHGLIDAATVADVESALGEAQSFNVMALTQLIADYPAYFVKELAEDYFAMPSESYLPFLFLRQQNMLRAAEGDDHQGPNAAKNQEQETEDGPLPLSYFSIVTDPTQDRLSIKWPSRFGDHFLPAISAIIAQVRIEKRNPTFADYVVSESSHKHDVSRVTSWGSGSSRRIF